MSFPAILCVLYTGIVGRGADGIDQQLGKLVAKAVPVARKALALDARKILARHQPEAHDLVTGLATDAVLSGELTRGKTGKVLHLVLYAGDGRRKDVMELPLDGDLLGAGDIEAIESNLVPDLKSLSKTQRAPEPPPTPVSPEAPPVPEPAPEPASPAEDTSLSREAGEQVERLGIEGSVGLGLAMRTFAPGPKSIIAFSSSPVATVRFDGAIRPRRWAALYFSEERSLGMTTQVGAEIAPTDMQRWEIMGEVDLLRGALRLGGLAGIGHRSFTIQSKSSARTPDGDYTYLILGAQLSGGTRGLSLTGTAALQPVTSGAEATDMDFGGARRWAIDLELTADWQPVKTIFVRPRVAYQRFTWSFPDAGTRGAGGAVDSYFVGELSVGARY